MSNATLIADYLKENFPIEQIKYNMYVEGDIYHRVPVLVFRFVKDIDKTLYDELRESVESFQGKIKWTVFKSFYGKKIKNYLLCPEKLYEMERELHNRGETLSEKDYFSNQEYKELCEDGVSDIPHLFTHITKTFVPK